MSSSANGIPTRPYAEAALYHHLWYDEKGGYPREYTHKGNDNAILYQILTCADCLGAATDSVGRLITVDANSYTAKSSVKTWSWFYNFGFCLWHQFVYPYIVVLFKVLSVSRGHIVKCTNFIQLICSFCLNLLMNVFFSILCFVLIYVHLLFIIL